VVFRTGPAWDRSKAPGEQAFFKEHSRNLAAMRTADAVVLGGRYADVGPIVVRAGDEAEVRALLASDPSAAPSTPSGPDLVDRAGGVHYRVTNPIGSNLSLVESFR
jgi:hypothetical protein